MLNNTKILHTFPGTGMRHFCKNTNRKFIDMNRPLASFDSVQEYVNNVSYHINKVDVIFINFELEAINMLCEISDKVTLIYPNINIKEEYHRRYSEAYSAVVAENMMDVWEERLNDLSAAAGCHHVVMNADGYISHFL